MPQAAKKPAPAQRRNPPAAKSEPPSRPLAATLQRQAGNQAVSSLVQRDHQAARLLSGSGGNGYTGGLSVSRLLDSQVVIQRAPGPLTPAQEKSAITFNR